VYGYLAIQGGFLAPTVLSSVSFYDGITPIERIRKGDKLFYDLNWKKSNEVVDLAENLEKINYSDPFLVVMKGPEFDGLCDQTRFLLENDQFVLSSEINRMGYRLTANEALKGAEILTSPVQPGTIQLTPSGQLIVLMKDGQTTGGYARILQLSATSLSKLAQKRPGDTIKFIF
jgi:allophanate hydrolase subunit 2